MPIANYRIFTRHSGSAGKPTPVVARVAACPYLSRKLVSLNRRAASNGHWKIAGCLRNKKPEVMGRNRPGDVAEGEFDGFHLFKI